MITQHIEQIQRMRVVEQRWYLLRRPTHIRVGGLTLILQDWRDCDPDVVSLMHDAQDPTRWGVMHWPYITWFDTPEMAQVAWAMGYYPTGGVT